MSPDATDTRRCYRLSPSEDVLNIATSESLQTESEAALNTVRVSNINIGRDTP